MPEIPATRIIFQQDQRFLLEKYRVFESKILSQILVTSIADTKLKENSDYTWPPCSGRNAYICSH